MAAKTVKNEREERIENIMNRVMKDKMLDSGLNKYRFTSREIVYAVGKGFTDGYGMQMNTTIYGIDETIKQLTKEMRELVERILIKYTNLVSTNSVVNAINCKNDSVGTRDAIEAIVGIAYDNGKDFRQAYDKAMKEILAQIRI